MNIYLSLIVSLGALLTLGANAQASDQGVQDHASIRDAARQHIAASADDLFTARAEVSVGRLDSRLKLTACDQTLETYDSPNGLNGGRGVVGVRCNGSKPWKIFVPVTVALMESVVVTRRPLTRGQAVQADDLVLSETDVSRLHKAYFTRVEDVVGLRAKRAIGSGKTLHAGLLKREQLVRRGKAVSIMADFSGLQVSMQGKAMSDGSYGDRIKVKNLTSGRIISGTVAGNDLVKVLN
jgi:flagella basal body P-ring formation protein FlgA